MVSNEEFFARLSGAELDEAEQIEKDVHAALTEGLSKESAQAVIRGVMVIRQRQPDAVIANVVDVALRQGMTRIVAQVYGLAQPGGAQPKPRKAKLVR